MLTTPLFNSGEYTSCSNTPRYDTSSSTKSVRTAQHACRYGSEAFWRLTESRVGRRLLGYETSGIRGDQSLGTRLAEGNTSARAAEETTLNSALERRRIHTESQPPLKSATLLWKNANRQKLHRRPPQRQLQHEETNNVEQEGALDKANLERWLWSTQLQKVAKQIVADGVLRKEGLWQNEQRRSVAGLSLYRPFASRRDMFILRVLPQFQRFVQGCGAPDEDCRIWFRVQPMLCNSRRGLDT